MSTQWGRDRQLIQELLLQTCRSIQWRAHVEAPIADRIEVALAEHALHVSTPDVDLHVQLTRDFGLTIAIRVLSFGDDAEACLCRALCQDRSLMAELVKAEWQLVRTACRTAERTAGSLVLLTTVPEA